MVTYLPCSGPLTVEIQILEVRKSVTGGTKVDFFPRLSVVMIFQKSSCITNTQVELRLVISLILGQMKQFQKWFISGGQNMGDTTKLATKSLERHPPCRQNAHPASRPCHVLIGLAVLSWISNLKHGVPPTTSALQPLLASPAIPNALFQKQRSQQPHHRHR